MENIKKHRKFIHDISNAITITEGSVLSVTDTLREKFGEDASLEIERLLKAQEYLKKIVVEIKDYRSFIMELEDKVYVNEAEE